MESKYDDIYSSDESDYGDYKSTSSSNESLDEINYIELPVAKYKNEIIEAVADNQVVIITGKTGCGKTTQVPQYLLDAGLNNNRIIGITQPRPISAVSIAKRIAKERRCVLGREVGYQKRFETRLSSSTKIKVMTEGILLNDIRADKWLRDYGVIIIDDMHERSTICDILLGILKDIVDKRRDLRIVICSATINLRKLLDYFEIAKIVEIKESIVPKLIEIHDKPYLLWTNEDAEGTSEPRWNTLIECFERENNAMVIDKIMLEYVYPRLDANVSLGVNHLLKSPFCVHSGTGRICVSFRIDLVDDFNSSTKQRWSSQIATETTNLCTGGRGSRHAVTVDLGEGQLGEKRSVSGERSLGRRGTASISPDSTYIVYNIDGDKIAEDLALIYSLDNLLPTTVSLCVYVSLVLRPWAWGVILNKCFVVCECKTWGCIMLEIWGNI